MTVRGIVARRVILGVGLALTLAAALCWPAAMQASGEKRTLSLFNIHTKESLTVTFKTDGRYDADSLKQLNHFMRDWRRNEQREMDPELIDLIRTLHQELGSKEPVKLISAYRSATTNNKLRRKGGGQAKNSQHIQGKAADIQFLDVPVKTLRNSALIQEWGGVGYYPTSGVPFVHVDTGRVRMWPRIPRLELAALFPDGHSKYLPEDNKPITPQDYKVAVAQGLVAQTKLAAAVRLKPAAQEEDVTDADDVVEADETVAQAEPLTPAQPESAAGTPKPIL